MLVTESSAELEMFAVNSTSKRIRVDSSSDGGDPTHVERAIIRNLELEGVKELFQDYDLLDTEAVACVICGKNYKSKLCVKKHLWEHSVYWDLFDGLKKQQRVLSIQAAIILAIKSNPSLSILVITQSSNNNKKHSSTEKSSGSSSTIPRKRKSDNTLSNDMHIKVANKLDDSIYEKSRNDLSIQTSTLDDTTRLNPERDLSVRTSQSGF